MARGAGRLIALLCGLALCSAAVAAPQVSEADTARAKSAFERGRQRYAAGDYEGAAKDFELGYGLTKRPAFLVNLGQSYRQLGQLEQARSYYTKFLELAPPQDPQRAGVVRIVGELDREIAEHPVLHPTPTVESPKPTPQPQVQLPTSSPAPQPKPFIRRHWWIIPVSAAAVTGIALGIYFGVKARTPELDCSGANLGCLQ